MRRVVRWAFVALCIVSTVGCGGRPMAAIPNVIGLRASAADGRVYIARLCVAHESFQLRTATAARRNGTDRIVAVTPAVGSEEPRWTGISVVDAIYLTHATEVLKTTQPLEKGTDLLVDGHRPKKCAEPTYSHALYVEEISR